MVRIHLLFLFLLPLFLQLYLCQLQLDWTDRKCGDIDTNPNPTFVGKKINNLTYYKNRLGILSGENLVLTENASFFNYFSTTSTQVLDTDPIDIAASGTNVTTLKNSVSFNETLLLFSNTAQYKLDHAGAEISPTTAILNEVSSFEHDESVTPVSAGKFAYFAQKRNNNTAIREYYADDDTLTNDGLDITVSVQNLLPTNPYQIISNTVEDTLIFLHSDIADNQTAPYVTPTDITATNADTMFIYKYFFDYLNWFFYDYFFYNFNLNCICNCVCNVFWYIYFLLYKFFNIDTIYYCL